MADPKKKPRRVPRILLVENDDKRVGWFKVRIEARLPGVRVVHCSTGGTALRLLELDPSDLYIGVLLDHDLDRPGMPNAANGKLVVRRLIECWSDAKAIPIFVHSANTAGGPEMREALEAAGFTNVNRAMFHDLDDVMFNEWLGKVAAYRDDFFDDEADED